MGVVALVGGFVVLVAAAALVAAALRLPTATDAALGAYVTFSAMAIAIVLALSLFQPGRRSGSRSMRSATSTGRMTRD
jgi:hypothetical protein